MKHMISYQPSYTLLKLRLEQGESIRTEAGAMVSMTPNIEVKTNMQGGLLGSLKRSVLGGESFFMNTYTASSSGEITLAPNLPGDITFVQLHDQEFLVQSGSFLASSEGIEIDTKFGGSKSFFSSEGLFWLKISGTGIVYLSSYGAIDERILEHGENFIVDTGHIVAFESHVDYKVRPIGNVKSTLFSGEGLVCDLKGPGKIFMQTRSEQAFLKWLIPKIPSKSN